MTRLNSNISEFPSYVVEKFIEATNYVLETVTFRAWDEGQMRARWRRNSLNSLLEIKEINHLFPCIDTAILATSFLTREGEDSSLALLTEEGAMKAFRGGRKRVMHIDSTAELTYDGVTYKLDIGCGDITLIKPSDTENTYLTTRPEPNEKEWERRPFFRMKGKVIEDHPDIPVLSFIESPHNTIVPTPYAYVITLNNLHTVNPVSGEANILTTNKEQFNIEEARAFNKKWVNANRDLLPGIKEFRYEE